MYNVFTIGTIYGTKYLILNNILSNLFLIKIKMALSTIFHSRKSSKRVSKNVEPKRICSRGHKNCTERNNRNSPQFSANSSFSTKGTVNELYISTSFLFIYFYCVCLREKYFDDEKSMALRWQECMHFHDDTFLTFVCVELIIRFQETTTADAQPALIVYMFSLHPSSRFLLRLRG